MHPLIDIIQNPKYIYACGFNEKCIVNADNV